MKKLLSVSTAIMLAVCGPTAYAAGPTPPNALALPYHAVPFGGTHFYGTPLGYKAPPFHHPIIGPLTFLPKAPFFSEQPFRAAHHLAIPRVQTSGRRVGAASGATPWPLGVFPPTTSYNGGYSTLETFFSLMGVSFIPVENFYVDFDQDPAYSNVDGWRPSSQYNLNGFQSASENGGPNNSSNPWLPSSGVIPMGSLPMAVQPGSSEAQQPVLSLDQYLQNISAGNYDSVWTGVVQDWYNAGYHTQYWRPGVEFNEGGNIYNCGTDSTCMSYWRSAFQHIYTTMHNEAASIGANVTIIWNPGADAGGAEDPTSASTYWPGAAYVDQIGLDLYGNAYPDNGNNPCGTGINASCEAAGSSPALSLFEALNFAKAQGKSVSFDETGAGGNSDGPGTGGDNPLLQQWLAAVLQATTAHIAFVSLWDSNGGCTCAFTPTGSAGKPNEAAAWAKYFGAGAAGGNITPSAAGTQLNGPIGSLTDSNGNSDSITLGGQITLGSTVVSGSANAVSLFWTGSVLEYINTGGQWFIVPLTGGTPTTSTAPTGYTAPHAASAANTQVNGTTGSFYDSYGNQWAINSGGQITVNGAVVTSSNAVVTIFWTGAAIDQLNSGGQWYTQPLNAQAGTGPIAAPTGYSAPGSTITIAPATFTIPVASSAPGVAAFPGLTITDGNTGTETVTVSVSNTAHGSIQDPNATADGSTQNNGVLTMSGTAAAMSTDIAALQFAPISGLTARLGVTSTTVTVGVIDAAGKSASAVSTINSTQYPTAWGGSNCN